MKIYQMVNGQPAAPVDESSLRARYQSGEINPQTLVWREGQPDWMPIAQFIQTPPSPPMPAGWPPIPPAVNALPTPYPAGQISPPAPEGRRSGMALAALICGLVSLVTVVPALPAVILGHLARADCQRDRNLSGRGMATAGLVLGYIVGSVTLLLILIGALSDDSPTYYYVPW